MSKIRWQEILPQLKTTFRESYDYPHKKVTQWFPGHMNRGLKQMESKLKSVDCILEVHDARIPISGRNPKLAQKFATPKPHILILNKADLIPAESRELIKSALKTQQEIDNVIFTNSKKESCPGLKAVIKNSVELITSSERYNRKEAVDYNLMVIGVPNVGKSSLINALRGTHLRKRHSLIVAPYAGVTKNVHERIRVSISPSVYLLDTPGIMNPNINSMDTGMRLASCATFKDHLVGEEIVADYLLYLLNKNQEFGYVSALGLETPTDNIHELMIHIAVQRNLRLKIRDSQGSYREKPDFKACAQIFLNHFRHKDFGPILLDKDLLNDH